MTAGKIQFRFPETLYNEYENFRRFDPMLEERRHVRVPGHVIGLRDLVFKSVKGRHAELLSPERESSELKSYARVKIMSKTMFDRIFTTHIAWVIHKELYEDFREFGRIYDSIASLDGYDKFYKIKSEVHKALKSDAMYDLFIVIPNEAVGMLTFGEQESPLPLPFMYSLGIYYFCKDYEPIPELSLIHI